MTACKSLIHMTWIQGLSSSFSFTHLIKLSDFSPLNVQSCVAFCFFYFILFFLMEVCMYCTLQQIPAFCALWKPENKSVNIGAWLVWNKMLFRSIKASFRLQCMSVNMPLFSLSISQFHMFTTVEHTQSTQWMTFTHT